MSELSATYATFMSELSATYATFMSEMTYTLENRRQSSTISGVVTAAPSRIVFHIPDRRSPMIGA